MKETDTLLIQNEHGRYYEVGSDTPFSGIRKTCFSTRFWEKEKKLECLHYFEGGRLVRYIGYYRNGQVRIDHILGKYPTRFHRDGRVDKRPEVNHQ